MSDPYLSYSEAQAYFDERLSSEAWDEASTTDKTKALKMATKAINKLYFSGELTDSNQINAFPRGGDTVVPQDILDATCEIAIVLLDGFDEEIEKANLAAVSQGVGDARATYAPELVRSHIVAGIASGKAWNLLKPYLRDPYEFEVSRVS